MTFYACVYIYIYIGAKEISRSGRSVSKRGYCLGGFLTSAGHGAQIHNPPISLCRAQQTDKQTRQAEEQNRTGKNRTGKNRTEQNRQASKETDRQHRPPNLSQISVAIVRRISSIEREH